METMASARLPPMRVAVVSDIHSNLLALEAVLDDVGKVGVDEIWCLGDIVGYGPEPSACIDIIRHRCAISLAGNHDLGAIGSISIDDFNPHALAANIWTSSVISDTDKMWLGSLPTLTLVNGVTMAHGSPREPVWEYVFSSRVALENFDNFGTNWCLVGHSHTPLVIVEQKHSVLPKTLPISLEPITLHGRAIINPGSVGQPRDGDPRASYAILNLERQTLAHRRVAYDVKSVQEQMLVASLPPYLIDRLELGR